jgi:ferredoxin
MTRLEVDHEACTGHGRCYDLAPALFEPDDYGHGQVTGAPPLEQAGRELAEKVIRSCPERAIRLAE